jgi:hypothetical protein
MGAIHALLDNVTVERARALADKVKSQDNRGAGYECLSRSSAGIDVIREQLSSAGPKVGADVLDDENINWLVSTLGYDRGLIKESLNDESKEKPRWSNLLKGLDAARADVANAKPDVEREEALALEAEKARLALPDGPAADRRLRYEKAIDAEFYRTLATLEAVQRARRSRSAPAA